MKKLINLSFLGVLFTFNLLIAQTQSAPSAEWKKSTWAGKDINGNPITVQNQSGDEWWYSHKNLNDPTTPGIQWGYVGVGYAAYMITQADIPTWAAIYNEGPNSPHNPITATSVIDIKCEELETTTDRTQYRGKIGFTDLNGNLTFYKMLTFIDLQEVITDATGIYVIGTHEGVKSYDKSIFLSYNPTSATPNNNFDLSTPPAIINDQTHKPHMYIAKLDYSGTVLWQHLYGAPDYNTDKNAALKTTSFGFDLIKNSVDGMIYASGFTEVGVNGNIFVVKIDPSTGYLIAKNSLSNTGVVNSINAPVANYENASICEIGNTGKMVVASTAAFFNPPNVGTSQKSVVVYSIDQNLVNNSSWSSNPIVLVNSSTPIKYARTWEVNYHKTLNQIMIGVFTDCSPCSAVGSIENNGFIYRLDNSGQMINSGVNPSPLGIILAGDLRIGVIETSDGGFAAVSARRNLNLTPPTATELGPLSGCPEFANPSNTNYTQGPFQSWDSDPLVVKFNPNGSTKWVWSEDVVTGRNRQPVPGDLKRAECMYKITEAEDGGLTISGNNSFNYDDNYMVKLRNDCYNSNSNFDYLSLVVQPNTTMTINSSKKIKQSIVVYGTLIITGINTIIEFSDSSKTGEFSGIIISLGGKMIINDATLTSLQGCVQPGMWCGIIMQSNIQFNQNQTFPIGQPSLIMNNAKLFNAKRGVLTGMYNTIASGGGIVKASNCTFKNNYIDVEFIHYNNSNNFNSSIADASFFNNCTFLADNLLNDKSFVNATNNRIPTKAHIVLNDVKGINIKGCTFKTDMTNLANVIVTDDRGIGIKSFNSTFFINDNCALATSNGCVQFAGTAKFENLQSGIVASSSNILKNYRVENTTFLNCFKGIQQSGVNYSTVQTNTFLVNAIVPPTEKVCVKGINVGNPNQALLCYPAQYYLNQCDVAKHSNNLYRTLGPQNSLGTVYNLCNGSTKYSYRNTYNSMYRGHQLQAGNTNLQIKCNVNSTTKLNDIAVTSGAVSTQGNCNSATDPANNLLSHLGPAESDIKSTTTFQYRFNSNPTAGFQVPFYVSTGVVNSPCSNLNPFVFSQVCPVELNSNCNIPCNLIQVNNISNSIAQNNAILAAAAAPSLVAAINSESSGNVKNILLTHSPYLSDEILLEFINTPPEFSNGILKNVIEANQPVSNAVWQAILALNLPGNILTQLQSRQVGINARQALIENINQLIVDKQFYINEALLLALNPEDTLTDYSQVESILKLDNTGEYYDDLVDLYLITKQFSNAQAYIDSLNKKLENRNLVSFLNLSKLAEQEGTWENMIQNPTITNQLFSYAFNVNSKGSALAQAVRNTYIEESLYDAIENFNDGTGARSSITEAIGSVSSSQSNLYKVFPNPFTNELNIKCQLVDGEFVKIQLTEIGTGRIILTKEVYAKETEIKLASENLTSGVYLISFLKIGQAPVYYKLINIK